MCCRDVIRCRQTTNKGRVKTIRKPETNTRVKAEAQRKITRRQRERAENATSPNTNEFSVHMNFVILFYKNTATM